MASSDASTSDSRSDVPVERSDGNGGRRGRAMEIKTKRNMASKALIVCDRWGPAIHGGVTDGLHLVIKLLRNMGISVHCTALQASKEEEREAEELGVTLELPTKTGTLQFREPHRDWLLHYHEYYPNLEELANVKFVFGFSAFTSEAAFKILNKEFPKASCYLINLFDEDDITPLIVGCSKVELEFRKKVMSDEFKKAKCSFSVGERVYAKYRRHYRDSNQQLLSPTLFEEYLSPSISEKLPILEDEAFQILSIVQEYEFEDPEKLEVIINAINTVAEDLDQLDETPPVWKIIGIPASKEEEIVKKLKRSPTLEITPTHVTTTEEFNRHLFSSHLVLIPPSSTSYANLTLAAMCAAIPVVFPRRSHSQKIVDKHIGIIEAQECAINMDRDPAELAKRITSAIRKNPTALKRARMIRQHIIEKVAGDIQGINEDFIATLTTDMQDSPYEKKETAREAQTTVQHKDRESSAAEHEARKAGNTENNTSSSGNQESKGDGDIGTEIQESSTTYEHENTGHATSDQGRTTALKTEVTHSIVEDTSGVVAGQENTGMAAKEQRRTEHRFMPARAIGDGESDVSLSDKATTGRKRRQDGANNDDDKSCTRKNGDELKLNRDVKQARKGEEQNSGKPPVQKTKRRSRDSPYHRLWLKKNKRKRLPRQIEIKVRLDGIIPKEGKRVREVDAAFYASKRTQENAILVGKQLDQRRKGTELHQTGEGSISYIMDCQSLEALESLMGDYSSRSLHRMVKSTFLSESLLDEIGALYLSIGTSIDYEEYLLCRKELADTEGKDIHQQPIEAIEEMNEKIESDIKRKKATVTIEQVKTRERARDRDILRGMEVERERVGKSELDELMHEWIKIKTELQQLNNTHSELVFDRMEFVRNTGAIIDEVDIPLELKQELMMAFQKSGPLVPDKTGKPCQQLVIEGDVLMEYVENIVHDFDIPTERKQDVIKRFRQLVQTKSKKTTAKASLTAKQDSLREHIQEILDKADIPDEQKEIYQQLMWVERGTPLSNTVRVLLPRDGKKSSGEVFDPWGLTINHNGHVLVCDYRHGSVKTVTADTAQILTSVTVHGLPHNFQPTDTKMADNGDYYTADEGNKCIVVSDAKSEVKQIIAMGKLKLPTSVFVDKDRNVFIADYHADCVIKCNGDGDIISSQQLSEPWSLTMNSKYQLIVSCQGDVKCIYVLDSNLEILNQFGSDHLENPWGVTVDNADNIYVADDKKIVKFDRQGEYQETVTEDGNATYIAVFTDGRIVYSDVSDYTVKVIYK